MNRRLFDDLTAVYEAMIDWPKRLTNEEPFYRRVFERFGVQRVLDVACGAGRHAAMFHSWGLGVEGADVSPAMIARARSSFGEPEGLRFAVRSFTDSVAAGEPFDAAICVGNSLALAPDLAAVEQALTRMTAAVRPGGALVVQVLNLWRLPDGPCQWQKSQRAAVGAADVWIAKGVHRCGTGGYVDLVVAEIDGDGGTRTDSIAFLGLEAADLQRAASVAGAVDIEFFGGYQEQPYQRSASVDLILTARKA